MNCDEQRALRLLREEGLYVDEREFRKFCTIDEPKRTRIYTPREIADRYIVWRRIEGDEEERGKKPFLYKGDSVPHGCSTTKFIS